jgi:glycosyltransferase involved in cell wall biosynthesis
MLIELFGGKHMRIIVNDIAASPGGALSVLKSFYKYLTESDIAKEHEWIFLLSDRYIEERDNIKLLILDDIKKSWFNRLKFDLFVGKNFISKLNPDVVFSLQNTITFGINCPQAIYMHQSIPFQKIKRFSFFKQEERLLAIYQYIIGSIIKSSIRKADMIIVQTQWIRDAVIEFTGIDIGKTINIFPNIEDYSDFMNDEQFDRHRFFYPASKHLYKNHQCIYDACDILMNRGVDDFNIELTIVDEIYRPNIITLGELSFETVIKRYNMSTLIFPSYLETVGLPLIEARQMGTIILASDCPFSKEALEGYGNAYFFNPFKPQELADLMEKVLLGKIIRKPIYQGNKALINGWETVINNLISFASKGN